MTTIEVELSTAKHVKELIKTLRQRDLEEASALGVDPEKALFYSYRHASYRKTALIDGVVSAMWGVQGSLVGNYGYPYLVTGHLVESIPARRFINIYLDEVQQMRKIFPYMENYVDANYKGAVKMLKLAGFKLENPQTYGPLNKLFQRFILETKEGSL